jgi:hypothetical protein
MVRPRGVDFDAARYNGFGRLTRPDEILPVMTKPTNLPMKLVINLKTDKALGLAIPDKLLSTANEVIE